MSGYLHFYNIPDRNLDKMLTQFTRDMSKDLMSILKFRSEHGTGQDRGNLAFDFDNFFSGHICINLPSRHLDPLSQVSPFIEERIRYYEIHDAKAHLMPVPKAFPFPNGKGRPLFHAIGV